MVGAEIALASMRRMYFAHMEGREICYLADKKAEYISSKRADLQTHFICYCGSWLLIGLLLVSCAN